MISSCEEVNCNGTTDRSENEVHVLFLPVSCFLSALISVIMFHAQVINPRQTTDNQIWLPVLSVFWAGHCEDIRMQIITRNENARVRKAGEPDDGICRWGRSGEHLRERDVDLTWNEQMTFRSLGSTRHLFSFHAAQLCGHRAEVINSALLQASECINILERFFRYLSPHGCTRVSWMFRGVPVVFVQVTVSHNIL